MLVEFPPDWFWHIWKRNLDKFGKAAECLKPHLEKAAASVWWWRARTPTFSVHTVKTGLHAFLIRMRNGFSLLHRP